MSMRASCHPVRRNTIQMQPRENILVIKLSALGDFVIALPFMACIRAHHPHAHITLLTTKPFEDIALRSGYFDAVVIDERPPLYHVPRLLRLRRALNHRTYARVYDLHMNNRTAFYRRLLPSPKPEWSGIHPQGGALSYHDPDAGVIHARERHRRVLALAGIACDNAPDMAWLDADVSFYRVPSPYVLIVPSAAARHPGKRWNVNRFAGVAGKLVRMDYTPVLIGSDADAEITGRIKKAIPSAIDLTGRTSLFEVAALARGAVCAIGNDTGPMHMAALAGAPCISLFSGESDPEKSAPVGGKVTVIQADDMNDITVDDVMRAFKDAKRE